ncbi:triphosphoribosyl-dephospho-CoA synthase [Natranaeroarchaeum sulfidigenes]|uniref:Triphosphoribosyl-dephospho-CoA synthetase n=1 Tax=Natranaeroarchaeum sulfidigenes TaxID=2784880 RepID=A0A897MWJ0_9EURY|nr:triphosphoribosyl-dephospho-CoA synthase [Natranaeroarchaeum sulfidigenes]QSG02675.1 Triphosphoribosyl-dephospho-CoA synthetase [Natranaeroarchaeum sulfidigenes]
MRTPAQNAELALLLEVAGTPKPGNVDRQHDLPGLRFEHFLAGAVGAQNGLRMALEPDVGIGEAFERSIEGMADQSGGNTQFGALLVLVPLVRATVEHDLTRAGVRAVVDDTTVEDAAAFYRAFDHVDVRAGEPPDEMDDLDVRRGSDAVSAVRERGLTLGELMAESADHDGVAREWANGFDRTFEAADEIVRRTGSVPNRAAATFLYLLSREPDQHVAKKHGTGTARSVMVRAQEAREGGPELVEAFSESLLRSGINPGTTADLTAGGLYIALERDGVEL